jgi:hypothetical protein
MRPDDQDTAAGEPSMMPPRDSQLLHAMAILLLERNLPCEDKPAPEGAEGRE